MVTVPQTLEAMTQISGQVMFREFFEGEIHQFVIAGSMGKHVVDGHWNLLGRCYRNPFRISPSFESVMPFSQIRALALAATLSSSAR